MSTASDLQTPDDIRRLVETFYTAVRPDPQIGHFFTELDWDHHIPRIVSFWSMVLFGDRSYTGDPMTAHQRLHQRIPMERTHFDRWLALWTTTVDQLFSGPKAEEAKDRARTIAAVMAHRVIGG